MKDPNRPASAEAHPPYVLVTVVLIGSMAVSQAIPWAKKAFAGDVPPLLAQLHPSIGPWLPLAVVAIAVGVVVFPPALEWPRTAFLVTVVAIGMAITVTMAAEAHGLAAISAPFRRPLEYYASVPLVRELGPRAFAAQFPHLGSGLSLHAATHGPSAVLFLWLLWKMTGGSVLGVSLFVALVGVAGAVPTYAIARSLADERGARLATLLFVCAPGVLIYSATSMDAVFMTVMACALAALVRFPRSAGWAAAAGVLWAIAFSFTFGAFVLAFFAIGVGVVAWRDGTATVRTGLIRACWILVGLVAGYLVLRLALGMNLVADFRAASRANYHDPSRARPYLYWVVANIPAFLWAGGVVQTALVASWTRVAWRTGRYGFETVLIGVLALSTLSGVFLGEVDHIWLFFIPPLAAVAGMGLESLLDARRLDEARGPNAADSGYLRGVLAGSLGQALLIQLLLYTYW
ncbi:MAG TPA: glycosyltransferase family 39 protein [Actinomycetota bacterium]|nr:glycosyltransferase family 39 protein [Actinomycetota bacterium]